MLLVALSEILPPSFSLVVFVLLEEYFCTCAEALRGPDVRRLINLITRRTRPYLEVGLPEFLV